jgi:hypothetical protein
MHGMAQADGELTEQGSPAFEAALPILSQLLKAETADREVRCTHTTWAARFSRACEDVGLYDGVWRRSGGLLIDGHGDLAQARPLPG